MSLISDGEKKLFAPLAKIQLKTEGLINMNSKYINNRDKIVNLEIVCYDYHGLIKECIQLALEDMKCNIELLVEKS
jgi:hypothetical protein